MPRSGTVGGYPGAPSSSRFDSRATRGWNDDRGKRLAATVLGAALIAFALSSLGGNPGGPPGANFGDPLPGLTADLQARFAAGLANFESVETVAGGLGPVFNNTSCAECHTTPATGGGSDTIETRFGRTFKHLFDPMTELGGSLIQSQGIGLFNGVDYVGEVVPPEGNIVAGRRTTPLFGLGLVGAVPDPVFLDLAMLEKLRRSQHRGTRQRGHRPGHRRTDRGPVRLEMPARVALLVLRRCLSQRDGNHHPAVARRELPPGQLRPLQANPATSNPNEPDNDDLQQFTDFITFLAPPPRSAPKPGCRTEPGRSRRSVVPTATSRR